jgi:hypothetical protein
MTEQEKSFLAKVEDTLWSHTGDTETVEYIMQEIRTEKEMVGGNLLAICWAVLVNSGFYGVAQKIQTWSVE